MAAEFEGRKAQVLIFRFQFQLFRQVKKSQQEKQGFDYSHPPKNSNRSFSFLSEKKSNFVKALDHLEASQQQSINISIEEGDAACGAQLGCGPARGQPRTWITFDKMLSLSRFMFYEFTLWLLASSFADTSWNLTNTETHSLHTEETGLCCLHFII